MIYIRKIFKQDLRNGKQIAFPKEASNIFFNFNYQNNNPDRLISFIFKDTNSVFDNTIINTRLYPAGSESRIDGELKRFLIDKLNVQIKDLIIFSKNNDSEYEFQHVSEKSNFYEFSLGLLGKFNHQVVISDLDNDFNNDLKSSNTIYYGAPGTGKSYKVDQIIKELDKQFYERVTFHPEYDNASFIGGYKPISVKDEDQKDVIKYEFVPQAFTNIYKRSWNDLENQYYLVIEEINRGNCAEIFGELFQLLDRNSGYTVAPSNELYKHLVEEFGDDNHLGIVKGLQLPPNLAILATMNTSDQSLFPMDSAFKRRWEWEYVPICYDAKDELGKNNDSFDFVIDIEDDEKYSWIKFIEKINLNHIKSNQTLGMDKCIGNYFIKPEKDNTIALKPFINKVIFYLWNDVFKDEDNNVFEENTSYEDFFPIHTNGKKKIKELFDRIELKPEPKPKEPSVYTEDDVQLSQVAEPQQELES